MAGTISRREFLHTGAVALAAGVARAAEARGGLAIGTFTDSHYTDRERGGSRYYRDSPAKLAQFVETMNETKPAFAIVLGDYMDKRKGGAEAKAADLKKIQAVYARLKVPRYYVIGNHDLDVFSKPQFVDGTGMPAPHYSFDSGAFHCIVLDANYRKDFSHYRAGNFNWTDTWVPPDEQKWLAADLKKTKGKCVVFVHQCLDDEEGAHGIKNAPDVRKLLEESGKVVAVVNGHNHRGRFSKINGIPYFTMRAMVEGPGLENNAFALATVSATGSVRIDGYGKQPDRKG